MVARRVDHRRIGPIAPTEEHTMKTIDSSASLTTLPRSTVAENLHNDNDDDGHQNQTMQNHSPDNMSCDNSTAGDSLSNSMSLTDLQPQSPSKPYSSAPSILPQPSAPLPLPPPPRHFKCPISNSLLTDPVIDREGNTYERTAILRWLVLTGATSPITGNTMSVEDLVEDSVVKSAIERWKKECWVRFLLKNDHGREIDNGVVVDLSGRSGAVDGSERSGGSYIGLIDPDKLKRSGNRSGKNKTNSSNVDTSERRGGSHNNLDKVTGRSSQSSNGQTITSEILDWSERSGNSRSSKSKATVRDVDTSDERSGLQHLDKLKVKSSKSRVTSSSGSAYSNKSAKSHASNKSAKSHASNKSVKSHGSRKSDGAGHTASRHRENKDGSRISSGTHNGEQHKSSHKSSSHKKNIAAAADADELNNSLGLPIVPNQVSSTAIVVPRDKTMSKKSSKKNSAAAAVPAAIDCGITIVPRANKHHPPPPPPKEFKPKSVEKNKSQSIRSNTHKSKKLTSSQKTAVTSNTTPTAQTTSSSTFKPPLGVTLSIPPPPFMYSPASKSKPHLSSNPQDHLQDSPAPPIRTILRRNTPSSVGSSFSSNLSANYSDGLTHSPLTSASGTHQVHAPMLPRHNGWSVPLGVHKIICTAPGLKVTTQLHRRSVPVKLITSKVMNAGKRQDLILPPGSFVEIVETQVHGDRVRGRIVWEEERVEEEEEDDVVIADEKKKKSIKGRTSRLLKRTSRKNKKESAKNSPQVIVEKYEGWISLQWANKEENDGADNDEESSAYANNDSKEEKDSGAKKVTDEDLGPWTEPVPLGVYRINFGGGLPLRETPERDSAVLGKLDRGRCVEVVQTQVKGDRVRARIMFMDNNNDGNNKEDNEPLSKKNIVKYTSGWISLLNALTGSSGASPVPLGAYVVVAEPGCTITEGGRLDSKIKGALVPGSCMEVVATRMEEGVVRGLIEGGGHVTLFSPPRNGVSSKGGSSSNTNNASGANNNANTNNNSTRKNTDGGRMYAMPVPLGTYQIIQSGLSVTTAISSTSSILMKLQLNATAEVIETRVEDGRVRGRICSVVNEDGTRVVGYGEGMMRRSSANNSGSGANSTRDNASGWIHLFEPNQRWAKIVCFKGGRPVGSAQSRRQNPIRAVC